MKYTITSSRAYRRNDEMDNLFETSKELKVGDVIVLDGLKWTVTGVIKDIPVNPNLSRKGCWEMVNRADNFEKISIAEKWLTANKVISVSEFDDMMMALSYISRELYRERA